ncbi:hypothetical protein Q1W73_16435 [Asticcacaulis sp. ZE23SCel15]|uniref:hypothetical protein n=1 Tax=Asticcacaulis sp. ZE23SCel15 TaxID=3059027 RepID=UPI00265FF2FD|nr:hypothetical protein [Asticcacaulis sp. ZE23SCel15]WKL57231.1 hypothetical protein Q1W73_16435 [Asticcacaulis sp. ZE23SCel15]
MSELNIGDAVAEGLTVTALTEDLITISGVVPNLPGPVDITFERDQFDVGFRAWRQSMGLT